MVFIVLTVAMAYSLLAIGNLPNSWQVKYFAKSIDAWLSGPIIQSIKTARMAPNKEETKMSNKFAITVSVRLQIEAESAIEALETLADCGYSFYYPLDREIDSSQLYYDPETLVRVQEWLPTLAAM